MKGKQRSWKEYTYITLKSSFDNDARATRAGPQEVSPPPLPLINTDFVNLYNKYVNENKKLNKEASETYHTAVLVQIPSCYRKNMD